MSMECLCNGRSEWRVGLLSITDAFGVKEENYNGGRKVDFFVERGLC